MPVRLSSIAEKLLSAATDSSKRNEKAGLKLRANSWALGTAFWRRHPALLQDHQLPGACAWAVLLRGWFSSGLWWDVLAPVDGAQAAGVVEEEPTPLEVLMELCWMASF